AHGRVEERVIWPQAQRVGEALIYHCSAAGVPEFLIESAQVPKPREEQGVGWQDIGAGVGIAGQLILALSSGFAFQRKAQAHAHAGKLQRAISHWIAVRRRLTRSAA